MTNNKTNDQVVLLNLLTEDQKDNFPNLNNSEHFEIYTASQILKDYDLSNDDINYGIVDGSRDGGVDSIYTFLNGELIKEDTEINTKSSNNHIELIIIQSKLSDTFNEDPIRKLNEFSKNLLSLSLSTEETENSFLGFYNSQVIDKINLFKKVYLKISNKFPKFSINYFYISTGETKNIHNNVKIIKNMLSDTVKDLFRNANFSFEFIGATELLELARRRPLISRELEVAESPIGTSSGSYLCLVTLPKYFEFITDERKTLSRNIFESNVRDYQGSVLVNEGIKKTLENKDSDNFWYLNNGVTIITPKATLSGKKLIIEDPQIVNGLQTSNEIYLHFLKDNEKNYNDTRTILVRVICEDNEDSRDRIIKATNSQTSIPPASLRSSDEIHRNIEDFLKQEEFFYDRRKNFYKNIGKPIYKIISISYLAQAMMAIYLLQPDNARARPSTLLNNDTEYKKIFSHNISINIYLQAIKIIKNIENFPKFRNLDTSTKTDIKFHIAMILGIKLSGTKNLDLQSLQRNLSKTTFNADCIHQDLLESCLDFVLIRYKQLGGTDKIAKSRDLVNLLLDDIIEYL